MIKIVNLHKRFKKLHALNNINVEFEKGQVISLIGPNGSGKTTLIKSILGLVKPDNGTILFNGLSIVKDIDYRRNIGYMSQKFSLYGDLTVIENIELFAGLYGISGESYQARRKWIIEMAGLNGREHLLTSDLPLGWKQRLALGCAVLHQPRVLFLDEPTSGVDPIARRAFWDLIDELAQGGTTVLVSTHYMEEAEYCHYLILMNRGQLIAEGRPADLRTRFDTQIVEVVVDDPAAAVHALQDVPGIEDAAMFGRELHVTINVPGDTHSRIRTALQARDITPSSLVDVPPSLEDVFVSLVRREGGAQEG